MKVKMRFKIHIISMIVVVAFVLSTTVYAQGMGGGMMGGGGGGKIDPDQWMSKLWNLFSNKSRNADQGKYRQREELSAQIQGKRQELETIFRSKNPDKALIDQKIKELERLEAELDAYTASSEGLNR